MLTTRIPIALYARNIYPNKKETREEMWRIATRKRRNSDYRSGPKFRVIEGDRADSACEINLRAWLGLNLQTFEEFESSPLHSDIDWAKYGDDLFLELPPVTP